jgi:phenylpyruvate tautomerase PptA (4-oxalocrotonate tautomerase family)
VNATQDLLTASQKKRIAAEITRAHGAATGAQCFFAQVIFIDIPAGNHFMGGVRIETRQIHVHGHIRAGRTEEQKKGLLEDIMSSLHAVTGLEKRYLWAYISELPPTHMVEYGHVLPKPGTEAEWLKSLPEEDRDYMLSLGATQ